MHREVASFQPAKMPVQDAMPGCHAHAQASPRHPSSMPMLRALVLGLQQPECSTRAAAQLTQLLSQHFLLQGRQPSTGRIAVLKTAHRSFCWAMASTEHGIEQALARPSSQQDRGMRAFDGWRELGGGARLSVSLFACLQSTSLLDSSTDAIAAVALHRRNARNSPILSRLADGVRIRWCHGGLLCVGLFHGDANAKMQNC